MTITLDTAMIGVLITLGLNLCAGVWHLAELRQITKGHEESHKAHREDIHRLDVTQREHGKRLAEHSAILGRRNEH